MVWQIIKYQRTILINLKEFSDDRGNLIAIDKEIPFSIKRVYFIYNVPSFDIVRAGHAHKKNIQALISIKGSCLISIPKKEQEVLLDHPSKCHILAPEDWHELKYFSNDCILLVLASEHYDLEDYVDEL